MSLPQTPGTLDHEQAAADRAIVAKIERRRERRRANVVRSGLLSLGLLAATGDAWVAGKVADIEPVTETRSADGHTVVREVDTRVLFDVATKVEVNAQGTPEIKDLGISGASDTTLWVGGAALANAALVAGAVIAARNRGNQS